MKLRKCTYVVNESLACDFDRYLNYNDLDRDEILEQIISDFLRESDKHVEFTKFDINKLIKLRDELEVVVKDAQSKDSVHKLKDFNVNLLEQVLKSKSCVEILNLNKLYNERTLLLFKQDLSSIYWAKDSLKAVLAAIKYASNNYSKRVIYPVNAAYNLPVSCYGELFDGDGNRTVVILERGMTGYYYSGVDNDSNVYELNAKDGITMAQTKAMQSGFMYGWNDKRVNPKYWEKQKKYKKLALKFPKLGHIQNKKGMINIEKIKDIKLKKETSYIDIKLLLILSLAFLLTAVGLIISTGVYFRIIKYIL